MTRQEIFDQVWIHLQKQGVRAATAGGGCMYRAEDGRMCAVGCLITDAEYNPKMEGWPVTDLQGLPERLQPHITFLRELQSAHDNNATFTAMSRSLAYIAKRFGLTIPETRS